jgi:hypothetical protein
MTKTIFKAATRGLLISAIALPLALAGAPALAEEKCDFGLMGSIPFKFAGFPNMMPALEGKIHGAPAIILADTGNYGTQMTMTGALKRQLPLQLTAQKMVGVGGVARMYSTRVSEYNIGTIASKAMQVPVIGQESMINAYDGIVGVDFLMQADLEVDFGARQFRFFKTEHCENTHLAYWDKKASVIPILPNYNGANRHPHLIVELNGVTMNAIIDTGASTTVVMESSARRAGVFPHTPGVREAGLSGGFGAKLGRRWVARFDSIRIGKEILGGPTLSIIDLPRESRGDHDILLGNDFLRAYRVLFANSQGRIYLTRTGNPFPPRATDIEPWVEQEATAGNPDAHLIMAFKTDKKDEATRLRWTQSAARLGQPLAQRQLGAKAWREGHAGEAVDLLKNSIKTLPSDWTARLELYLAQLEAGDRAGAEAELERASAVFQSNVWINGVFQAFLGRKPLDAALGLQLKDDPAIARLHCTIMRYEPWLRQARPDIPARSAALTALANECKVPALPVRSTQMPILANPSEADTDTDKGVPHA